MSLLRNLEDKIAGLVEGTFGRVFRTQVRPVEIARKLAREMEEHKSVSISKVYVPNEYAVYVSEADRERFADYEDALSKELCGYLLEHARLEKLALLARPQVTFHTDERLSLGEFGIQTRVVRPPEEPGAGPEPFVDPAEAVQGQEGDDDRAAGRALAEGADVFCFFKHEDKGAGPILAERMRAFIAG